MYVSLEAAPIVTASEIHIFNVNCAEELAKAAVVTVPVPNTILPPVYKASIVLAALAPVADVKV